MESASGRLTGRRRTRDEGRNGTVLNVYATTWDIQKQMLARQAEISSILGVSKDCRIVNREYLFVVNKKVQQQWTQERRDCDKGRTLCTLKPKPNESVLRLHEEFPKKLSAIAVQLRTAKTGPRSTGVSLQQNAGRKPHVLVHARGLWIDETRKAKYRELKLKKVLTHSLPQGVGTARLVLASAGLVSVANVEVDNTRYLTSLILVPAITSEKSGAPNRGIRAHWLFTSPNRDRRVTKVAKRRHHIGRPHTEMRSLAGDSVARSDSHRLCLLPLGSGVEVLLQTRRSIQRHHHPVHHPILRRRQSRPI